MGEKNKGKRVTVQLRQPATTSSRHSNNTVNMIYVKYRLQTGGPDNRAAARGRKIQHVNTIYVLYLHCSVFYTDPLIKQNRSLMQNKFRINQRPNSDWRASSWQLSIWQHL